MIEDSFILNNINTQCTSIPITWLDEINVEYLLDQSVVSCQLEGGFCHVLDEGHVDGHHVV